VMCGDPSMPLQVVKALEQGAPCRLRSLILDDNTLGDAGISRLIEALRNTKAVRRPGYTNTDEYLQPLQKGETSVENFPKRFLLLLGAGGGSTRALTPRDCVNLPTLNRPEADDRSSDPPEAEDGPPSVVLV
jgi:hypothetical protein